MQIQIKNRYTLDVIFECDAESIKAAVVLAVSKKVGLRDANLRAANLSGANLSYANLRDANLSGAIIDGEKITKQPLFIYGLFWDVRITDTMIKIGCKHFTIEQWESFDDNTINDMAGNALDFWNGNKVAILALANHHKVK